VDALTRAAHDDHVTARTAPAPASTRRRFRLAVVVASVVAAIVGSVSLVVLRSSERVDTKTGSTGLPPGGKVVARIRVGHSVPGIGKEGGGPLAVGEGAVWAMSNGTATLMRIDPARNAIVTRIKMAPPEALAAGDGAVWLAENKVLRVDPATNAVTATIEVGSQPEGIAVSPGAVWVANADGPSVSRIDPATNRVVATIRVGPRSACCARHTSVVASPRAVWVALPNGKSIVHVDPATNRVVGTAKVGYPPCGLLAADDKGVWSAPGACSNFVGSSGDVVARVDSRTNRLATTIPDGAAIGVLAAFGSVWVTRESGDVDQIDPHSGRVVARLHIVGEPAQLGVGFGSVWVNDDYGRVLRIDPQH
jgi:YVTN family beta-propeller protein